MKTYLLATTVVLTLVLTHSASAQLYMEDFDTDNSANWLLSANEGFGQSPSDGLDEPDASADFFFDYSTVGIPTAPNSTGGTTRGMKIQSNLIAGVFGGASASPVGQNFTGDYRVTFDLWGNYVGDPTTGLDPGGQGQTNMSTYAILTDGETGISPGTPEGVWFGGTVDGGSGADFRAYSIERTISYQLPPDTAVLDGMGQPVDEHATYHADSRNNTADLYVNNFGGVTAPQAQINLFPQQLGTTPAGSLGMEWHEVEIEKIGNIVEWSIDGILLITLDTTNFTEQPDGTNIAFGHSDINAGSSAEPDRFDLQFSLFDNINVEEVVAVDLDGDFNDDDKVDAADYVIWRKNEGTNNSLPNDGGLGTPIDSSHYDLWASNFGSMASPGGGNGAAAVPEPASLAIVAAGLLVACLAGRRRK